MTAPGHSSTVRPWTVWTPLGVALAVVLFLATVGSLGVGFGVMTNCTNTYRCTTVSCSPCATANTWLTLGWAVQGGLVLVGAALAIVAARRVQRPAVRRAAVLLGPVSIALIAATTWLAVRSF